MARNLQKIEEMYGNVALLHFVASGQYFSFLGHPSILDRLRSPLSIPADFVTYSS